MSFFLRLKNPCNPGFRLHWQAAPANTGELHLSDHILAVDLGKYKSVFCKYSLRTAEPQLCSVAANSQAFRQEFAQDNIKCIIAPRHLQARAVERHAGLPALELLAFD
jgi:hypothetical protein